MPGPLSFVGDLSAALLVGSVGAAPATVLLELNAVAVVDAVLAGDVVPPLALAAFERHVDALVTGHASPQV
jgi:hypothetical protein